MYRAVFISDIHFGTTKYEEEFLEFLENLQTNYLFIVGDAISFIVDKESRNLDRFFNILATKDWKVIYIIGNHEKENLYLNSTLFKYYKNLTLYSSYIYKNILIEHGDSFHYKDPINRFIKKKMFECKLSLYKRDKRRYPKIRNLYYIIKPLLKFVLYHSFINYMVKRARERGCEAIVCGHLHLPQIKEIKGIKYINSGDWVKHLSYIVEDKDGEFKLKYFKDIK